MEDRTQTRKSDKKRRQKGTGYEEVDGDDYQSHNVDTIRTVPCDASFLCLALCWWLCDRFSVGTWIYLIGFFFGIGGGAVTAWKFGQSVLRHQKRIETEPDGKKKKKRVSFNRHI